MLGALALDVLSVAMHLSRRGEWVRIGNRKQSFDIKKTPLSIRCEGLQTSNLHVVDVFPRFGRSILRAALHDWPFELASDVRFTKKPKLSFVIPHRGTERERHLHAVIRSIASLDVPVECIVVEQDNVAKLSQLPGNTRYLHLPDPTGSTDWNKCLALNAGAAVARGNILIFHDGDILVPERYGLALLDLFRSKSIDVAFPQRFLFYLAQGFTESFLADTDAGALRNAVPERVNQNWVGGTLAIRRDSFECVGGYDTRFTGWAGEDVEFYDRCQSLPGWFHGYIPFLHLWHPPQVGKIASATRARNDAHIAALLAQPRELRVEQLRTGRGTR